MSNELYDFRKPGRLAVEVQQVLKLWQRMICVLLGPRWSEHMPDVVEPRALGIELVRREELLAKDTPEVTTFRLDIAGSETASVIQVSTPVMLGLVSGMLGEQVDVLPEFRPTTNIERTLIDMLLGEFLQAANASQPTENPVEFQAVGRARMKELRDEFPESEEAIAMEFEFDTSFGLQSFVWVLSHAAVAALIEQLMRSTPSEAKTSPDLVDNVQAIPVQLVVRLGQARIQVAELARLRVGDVLLLNQRLTDPLHAEVGGKVAFAGWPGRVGNRQAFQISGVTE